MKAILVLILALIIEYHYPFKMKKARINIGPTIGVEEEVYVDIRYDAEQYKLYNCDDRDIIECIETNCIRIQKKIDEVSPNSKRRWRVNASVLNLVCDHYCTDTE